MSASISNTEPVSQRGIALAAIDERVINHDFHAANLNRTVSLIGSNLAMLWEA